MKCSECMFWQGNKYGDWADCYRVIGKLEPDLLCCYKTNEWGTIERFFDVPFDPHEVKYWIHDPLWHKLYLGIKIDRLGVRVVEEIRDDIVYDQKNGERVGRLKLRYFQTHRDHVCGEEDDE